MRCDPVVVLPFASVRDTPRGHLSLEQAMATLRRARARVRSHGPVGRWPSTMRASGGVMACLHATAGTVTARCKRSTKAPICGWQIVAWVARPCPPSCIHCGNARPLHWQNELSNAAEHAWVSECCMSTVGKHVRFAAVVVQRATAGERLELAAGWLGQRAIKSDWIELGRGSGKIVPAAARQLSQGLVHQQSWSSNRLICSSEDDAKHCCALWFALSDLFFLAGLGGGTPLCRRPLLLYALPYAGQPRRLLLLFHLVLLPPLQRRGQGCDAER